MVVNVVENEVPKATFCRLRSRDSSTSVKLEGASGSKLRVTVRVEVL
jgi:hypothetical protein